MPYAIDLKQLCGGYAYFSVFTHGSARKERRYEWRQPSQIVATLFAKALGDLGLTSLRVDSEATYKAWLHTQGWALIDVEFARTNMSQWLKAHNCVRSALGSFTDVNIASPAVLKRSLRGRSREQILKRDGAKCLWCGSEENLTLQHVLPYSLGGETHSTNLILLCEPHNQELADEYLIELYQLAGLHFGMEPSLLKRSDLSDLALARVVQFSSNIMHTRCDVW